MSTDNDPTNPNEPAPNTEDVSTKSTPVDVTKKSASPIQSGRLTTVPKPGKNKNLDKSKSPDDGSSQDEPDDETAFDQFFLTNFSPFSGLEDVIEWLDNTDEKFSLYKVSLKQRFSAIPLLIKGVAKRTYLEAKETLTCYDDFYKLLINSYASTTTRSNSQNLSSFSVPPTFISNKQSQDITGPRHVTFDDPSKPPTNSFNLTDSLPPHPVSRSTALYDIGTSGLSGEDTVHRSNLFPSHNSLCSSNDLDQTAYALRRAIIDNIIRSPKTFRGGKEDVKQWLEDIEQQFYTAQIPEYNKLDLVQYSLRGEALRWFKNNKSTFSSWNVFVKAFKQTFLSPFFEEIAFKKLESYHQGINQPIRSFYNEVLKLCEEADSSMSDTSKLRNLLNKTKPSLQLEIRKRKPSSSKQFLEFAIEVEELFHLSNLDPSNTDNSQDLFTPSSTYQSVLNNNFIPPPPPNNKNLYNNPFFYPPPNNNYSYPPVQPYTPSTQQYASPAPIYQPYPSYYPPVQPQQPYMSFDSKRQNNYTTTNSSSNNNSYRKPYRGTSNNNSNTSNTNKVQQTNPQPPQANTVSTSHLPSLFDSLQLPNTPDFCIKCNQQGHATSACPHF